MTDEAANPGGPAAGAASAPGLPAAVDRASFQAELDALRVRAPHRPVAAPASRAL